MQPCKWVPHFICSSGTKSTRETIPCSRVSGTVAGVYVLWQSYQGKIKLGIKLTNKSTLHWTRRPPLEQNEVELTAKAEMRTA